MNSVEQRLQRLMRYRSITDNQTEVKAMLDTIASELAQLPLHIQHHESNGVHSLTATTRDTKQPKLWLVAHADIVEGSDDLYKLQIEDGILKGRGVSDDKFAIAAFMEATAQLGDEIADHDFGIMITGDEEWGGCDGTGYLVSKGYASEVAFIPDGGVNWQIETQAKGVLRFLVEVEGVAAHGSRPWDGESAIEKLFAVIRAIQEGLQFLPQQEAARLYTSTLNIGTIKGGEVSNQVPAYAQAGIDIRYIEPEEATRIRATLQKIARELEGMKITEELNITPVRMSVDDPWIQKLTTILESEGIAPGFCRSTGGTDARFFAEQGTSVLVAMPNGGGLHADAEWLEQKGLAQLVEVTKKLIQEV